MDIRKYISKYAISEIQNYLADMNWANREYKGEQLNIFLKGLTYALWDYGFTFSLRCYDDFSGAYKDTGFKVEVHKYTNFTDCWSGKEHLADIFVDRIEKVQEDE